MDHRSAREQRIWEALESCRKGSDAQTDPQLADLAVRLANDPELRLHLQHVLEADEAIHAAFADVPVPAGLADRVARRVEEARPAAAAAPAAQGPVAPPAPSDSFAALATTTPDAPAPPPRRPGPFSRRRLAVGFAAISAAVALLAAVWIQTHRPRQETPASVLEEAMDFFGKDNATLGKPVAEEAPPAEYPMSRDLVSLPGVRWRYVEKYPSGEAVAYDLPAIGGRATLYVTRRSVSGLPPIPPAAPSLSTNGESAAAWQVGNMLYVLVVEGDAGAYSGYLDQSHGPLT